MKYVFLLLSTIAFVTPNVAFAADAPTTAPAPASRPAATGKVGDAYRELKLKDGRVLRDVKVKEILTSGIRVSHSDGGGRLSYSVLPDALVTKYGIDPEQAKVAEESTRKAEEERLAKVQDDALLAAEKRDREAAAAAQKVKEEEEKKKAEEAKAAEAQAAQQKTASESRTRGGKRAKAEKPHGPRFILQGGITSRASVSMDELLVEQDLTRELEREMRQSIFYKDSYQALGNPEISRDNFRKAERVKDRYVVLRNSGTRFSVGQTIRVYVFQTSEVNHVGTPIYDYEVEMNQETKINYEKAEDKRIAALPPEEKAKLKKELTEKVKELRLLCFDKKQKLLSAKNHKEATDELERLKEEGDRMDQIISTL